MATTAKTEISERIRKHGEQLLAIFPNATERDPIALCKKLRRLEAKGAHVALRLCNGPEYESPEAVDEITDAILAQVNELLGNEPVAVPIFINRDPRGYALKIDDEWLRTIPLEAMRERFAGLHRDWGGYGIIAPDLSEST